MAKETIKYPETFNEFYSEQHIADVKRIIDWLNVNASRTQSHLAKQTTYSPASVSTLINGIMPKDPSPVINAVMPIIEDTIEVNTTGEFVKTSTYRLVKMACDRARKSKKFSIVSGSPGVGKSRSLLQYKQDNPSTIYICGTEDTTSGVVLDELISALNIKNISSKNKAFKRKAIEAELNGSNRLIILDEADKCAADAADPLRTISDNTGCAVVLAGNVQLRALIVVGDNRYDLINDRVCFWPNTINGITEEDCSNLMRPYFTNDIELGDEFATLVKYAHEVTQGSARKLLIALLPNALEFYHGQQQNSKKISITCALFQAVAKQQMGIMNPPALPQKRCAVAIPAN